MKCPKVWIKILDCYGLSSVFYRAHSFSFERNSLVVPVGYVFVQLLYEIFHALGRRAATG